MQSIGTSPPPAIDEVEVSLFGPGFGECIVIHLGNSDWIIVDSCRDLDSKRPVALEYLASLGVDVERSVRRIVATHWHDDHIDGLSEVFRTARSSSFVCTTAFQRDEFKSLLQNYFGTAAGVAGSGIDELHGIFVEVRNRQKAGMLPTLVLAGANTIVWERVVGLPASVRALSPSAHDVLVGLARIHSEQFFRPNAKRRRLPTLHPNNVSVVLSVRVGDALILLGADLQESGDNQRGWRAIVGQWNPDAGLHEYFKVPHHGSSNAHYQPVWTQMLVKQPEVTLTPFRQMLPTNADKMRIRNLAGRASISAAPRKRRYRVLDPAVQRVVNGMTRQIWRYPPNSGHIRCRRMIASGSTWRCDLFGAAESL